MGGLNGNSVRGRVIQIHSGGGWSLERAEEPSAVDIGKESEVNYSCKRDRGGCPATR